jgi:hypothetical protein
VLEDDGALDGLPEDDGVLEPDGASLMLWNSFI